MINKTKTDQGKQVQVVIYKNKKMNSLILRHGPDKTMKTKWKKLFSKLQIKSKHIMVILEKMFIRNPRSLLWKRNINLIKQTKYIFAPKHSFNCIPWWEVQAKLEATSWKTEINLSNHCQNFTQVRAEIHCDFRMEINFVALPNGHHKKIVILKRTLT